MFLWPADCRAASTRRDSVPLALAEDLKTYANQLDTTVEPKCPSCGEEHQTVGNWLQRCPNAVALRQHLFGEPSSPLSVLATNLGSVLALARKTPL